MPLLCFPVTLLRSQSLLVIHPPLPYLVIHLPLPHRSLQLSIVALLFCYCFDLGFYFFKDLFINILRALVFCLNVYLCEGVPAAMWVLVLGIEPRPLKSSPCLYLLSPLSGP